MIIILGFIYRDHSYLLFTKLNFDTFLCLFWEQSIFALINIVQYQYALENEN